MLTNKLSKHFFAVFLLAAFFFSGCQKNSAVTENTVTETTKTEKLAKQFVQPISGNYRGLISEYNNLNTDELISFWVQINRINHQPGKVSVEEEINYKKQIEQYNKKSIELYGKPINKIDAEKLSKITYAVTGTNTSGIQNTGALQKPGPPPPGSCLYYNYPSLFYPVYSGAYSPASFIYQEVRNFYDESDPSCYAIEYKYSGTSWISMRPITPLGVQCMAPNPTGPWGFRARYDGSYTYIFAPKAFITSWFGTYENFNNNVRLSTQPPVWVEP